MHPNQKIKFNDWYMNIDPPMWMVADFKCMNVLINDNDNDNDNDDDNNKDNDHVTDELFVNRPVAIGYNVVQIPEHENLNLEKDGYINIFGQDCVEWFINQMMEIESYMKNYFKNELEINLDTIPEIYDQITYWLCEKEFQLKDVKENLVIKDYCHLWLTP